MMWLLMVFEKLFTNPKLVFARAQGMLGEKPTTGLLYPVIWKYGMPLDQSSRFAPRMPISSAVRRP
jgi:hypothetical protein